MTVDTVSLKVQVVIPTDGRDTMGIVSGQNSDADL
jgi:bifunctional DNA-binding transcriptional regulator/antitoxin component of YhaV-PrlF toxin-antitoxin module